MNTKLEWRLVKVVDCPPAVLTGCYNLLRRHFDGVSYESFRSDLKEKEDIAYLTVSSDVDNGTIEIGGFSTFMVKQLKLFEESHSFIFSGDTIVDHLYRNSFGLIRCNGEYFLKKLVQVTHSLWYVLLSKGCGTYRAMDFTFEEYSPGPAGIDEQLMLLAHEFFSLKYPAQKIIGGMVLRAKESAQRLRETSSDLEINEDDLGRFFLEYNPGYANGDELICIARVHPDNFTKQFKRVLKGVEI